MLVYVGHLTSIISARSRAKKKFFHWCLLEDLFGFARRDKWKDLLNILVKVVQTGLYSNTAGLFCILNVLKLFRSEKICGKSKHMKKTFCKFSEYLGPTFKSFSHMFNIQNLGINPRPLFRLNRWPISGKISSVWSFVSFGFLSPDQNSSWRESLSRESCNRQSQNLLFHLILHEHQQSNPPVWLSIKSETTLSSVLWTNSHVAATGMELVLSLTKAGAGDKASRNLWIFETP